MINESLVDVLRDNLLEASKSWKKGTVTLKTRSGKESVQGYTRLNLAVHKLKGTQGWTITHAPSGMAAVKEIVTKEAAIKIADGLISQVPEFAKANELSVMQVAKSKGRVIMTVVNSLKKEHNKRKPTKQQVDKKAREAEEEKEVKKYFDKIKSDKYDALLKQFFIYAENEGLSLDYRYQYHSSKEAAKKQEVLFQAFEALKYLKLDLDYAKRGLYTKEHKTKYTKRVKEYTTKMAKAKKMGMDVTKVDSAKKKYLVRYKGSGAIYYGGSADTEGSRKLGDEGPRKDGLYVMAASEKEARDIAQKQVNLRADLLMAEKV